MEQKNFTRTRLFHLSADNENSSLRRKGIAERMGKEKIIFMTLRNHITLMHSEVIEKIPYGAKLDPGISVPKNAALETVIYSA